MSEVENYMDVYRTDPEFVHVINPEDAYQKTITIELSAKGGGTVGRAYTHTQWIYNVWDGGTLVYSGADLGGNPASGTHFTLMIALMNFLVDAEAPGYDDAMAEFIAQNDTRIENAVGDVQIREHLADVESHECDDYCDSYEETKNR